MNPEDSPQPCLPIGLTVIAIEVVAGKATGPAGAVSQGEAQRLHPAHQDCGEQVTPLPARLERPSMTLQTEDMRLLAGREENVNPHGIADEGLKERGSRAAMDLAAEDPRRVPVLREPLSERICPVVEADDAPDVLEVRHDGRADDHVLILDEEGEVAIGRSGWRK